MQINNLFPSRPSTPLHLVTSLNLSNCPPAPIAATTTPLSLYSLPQTPIDNEHFQNQEEPSLSELFIKNYLKLSNVVIDNYISDSTLISNATPRFRHLLKDQKQLFHDGLMPALPVFGYEEITITPSQGEQKQFDYNEEEELYFFPTPKLQNR